MTNIEHQPIHHEEPPTIDDILGREDHDKSNPKRSSGAVLEKRSRCNEAFYDLVFLCQKKWRKRLFTQQILLEYLSLILPVLHCDVSLKIYGRQAIGATENRRILMKENRS